MVYHICRIFVFCSQALMNATLRRFCCEGGLTAKCSQQTKSRGQVFDPGLNQRPVPLIPSAKVRRFWEVDKYFSDLCPRLLRHWARLTTKGENKGGMVSCAGV